MIGRISKTLIRLRDLFRFRKFPGVQIHPSAVIDVPCEIGSGTRIWHFAHLYEGCSVGVDCMIGQNVMIGPNVSVGKGCKVQNNVSLYEGVTLGDGVFCGPGCVFTNVINPRAEIDRKHEFKPTLVRSGATLGANSTIVCGTTIGKFAFIGAAAVVTKNISDFEMVVGNPSRIIGHICVCGNNLPRDEWREATCRECGRLYALSPSGVRIIETSEIEQKPDD